MRRLPSFHALIFIFVWLLLMLAGRGRFFRDPGTFAHTALGERILETGSLFHRDIFSFTRFGEPWVAHQWLGECIMAVIHWIAGMDGLLVVTVSLVAFLFSGLALRLERSGMNLVLASLVLAFALAASSHHLHVRPHIVTILFMAVVYGRLCDVDANRADIGSLAWLIPMFVLWANIHGGVLGGLMTLLLTVSGWTLAWRFGGNGPIHDPNHLKSLWLITGLCLASPFANPYGPELPATWFKIMSSNAVSELIQEHASVVAMLRRGDPASFATTALLLSLGFFYLALLAATGRKTMRITWLIPAVWLLLSLTRIRHAPLFAVMAIVAIAEIFPHCAWVRRLGDKGWVTFQVRQWIDEPRSGFLSRVLLPTAVTGMALLAFLGSAQLPSTSQRWVKLDGMHWPIGLLPQLQALEKDLPSGSPIFNDMLFGGFLIYQTPRLRVFIDDRCELYGDDFLYRYVKAEPSDFQAWTKKYPFELALILPNSNYRKYFEEDSDWRVVHRSPAAILYQKRNPVDSGA